MSTAKPVVQLRLKILTFNLFHDYPSCRHIERRLAILEGALAREAPEIAVLQEVSVSTLYGHIAERLQDALRGRGLRYDFFYAPANGSVSDGGAFEEGSAILSVWPIVDREVRELAPDRIVTREHQGYRYVEHRIAVRATVAPDRHVAFDVFGTHVADGDGSTAVRKLQLVDLERFVDERTRKDSPAVIAGDFNARPESEEIQALRRRGFVDVCAGHEPGATNDPGDRHLESPFDTCRHRIDHIFVAPGRTGVAEVESTRLFLAQPVEIEPGRRLWASDHNGIVAQIVLRR